MFSLSSIQEWHDIFHNSADQYHLSNPMTSVHFLILCNLIKEIKLTLEFAIHNSIHCVAAVEHFQERIKELQKPTIAITDDSIVAVLHRITLTIYQLSYNFLVSTYPTLTSRLPTAEDLYGFRIHPHYAIEVLKRKYPDKKKEEYWEHEYEIRHLVKSRIYPQYPPNLTKKWPERVIPYDYSNKWPIRTKDVFIPVIIELYRHNMPNDNMYHLPMFPLNIWWSTEDAHVDAPVGSWALVWREWDCDQIHEGWIQRIAPYLHDSILTWQHWQTHYPANTESPLPLIPPSKK